MAEDASKPVDSTEMPEAARDGVAPQTPSAKDKKTPASTKKKKELVLSYFPQVGEMVEMGQAQQEPLLSDGDCSYIIVEERKIKDDNLLVIAPRELIKMESNPWLRPGRYLTLASASGWAVVMPDTSQSSSTTTKVSHFRIEKPSQELMAGEDAESAKPIQLYESAHLYLAWVIVRHGLEECNTVIKQEEEQKKTTEAIEHQAEGLQAVPTTKLSQQMDREFHKSMFKSLRQLFTSAVRRQYRNTEDIYILSFEQLLRRVKAFLPKLLTRKSPQRMKEAYEDVVDALNALWKYCGLQSLVVEEAAEEEEEANPGEEAAFREDKIDYETFVKLSVDERLEKIEAFDETPVLTGFDEEAEELEALPPPPNEIAMIPHVPLSEQHEGFINRIIDKMNGKELGGLRHSCSVFDVRALLRRLAVHFCTKQGCCNPCSVTSEMFAGGKTQLGKTSVKFVTALAACEAGLVPIVITPGSANTRELAMKFIRFTGNDLEGEAFPRVVTLGKLGNDAIELPRKEKLKLLEEEVFALDHRHTRKTIIVLNYNFRHLEVTRLFRDDTKGNHRSLVVILDEADEIFKSTEGEYEKMFKQEQELLKLLGRWKDSDGETETTVAHKGPLASPRLLMHVSATLLPCLIEYCYRDWKCPTASAGSSLKAEDFILLDPAKNTNYVGAKDFQAFKSSIPLYIGDLKPSNVYMNETMEEFYKEALAYPDRETFVVDFTSARVTSDGGMHEKITRLSKQYEFLGICQSGAGIDVFDSRYGEDMLSVTAKRSDKKKLDEVIDWWTEDHAQRPIVFMAGSLVYRGVSVRGTKRVPTHIVVCLGRTQPIDKVIQAVGRATGLFQKNLRSLNLGQESRKVQFLIPKEDQEQITVYNLVLDTFCDLLKRDADNKLSLSTKLRDALKTAWKPEVMTRPIGVKKRNNLLRLAMMFPDVCVQKIPSKAALECRTISELRQLATRCFVDVEASDNLPRKYRKASIVETLLEVGELRKKNPDHRKHYNLPLRYPTPPSTTSECEQVPINPRCLEFDEPDIPRIAGEDVRDHNGDDEDDGDDIENNRDVVEDERNDVEGDSDDDGDEEDDDGGVVEDDRDDVEDDIHDDADGGDYVEDSNEDVEDNGNYLEDSNDDVEDGGDYVEDSNDYVEDSNDYVEDSNDDVEDNGNYVEDSNDDVEDGGDNVRDLGRKRRLSADESNKLGKRQRCINGCVVC